MGRSSEISGYGWEYDFNHSSPGIPNIDTDWLPSYNNQWFAHYVIEYAWDWGPDTVGYNDPNDITHFGQWNDPTSGMYNAIMLRTNGLQSFIW